MNKLDILNLTPGLIYEVLCGTYNPNKLPNLAPMGIRLNPELVLYPYITSQTFKNIEKTESCSLNFSDDAWIFTWACFEKDRVKPFLKAGLHTNSPVLKGATAVVECNIKQITSISEEARCAVKCQPIDVKVQPKFVPFSRAFSLIIEMLIHATRIAHYETLDDKNKVHELKQYILYYAQIINRVARTDYPIIAEYILKQVGLNNASDSKNSK